MKKYILPPLLLSVAACTSLQSHDTSRVPQNLEAEKCEVRPSKNNIAPVVSIITNNDQEMVLSLSEEYFVKKGFDVADLSYSVHGQFFDVNKKYGDSRAVESLTLVKDAEILREGDRYLVKINKAEIQNKIGVKLQSSSTGVDFQIYRRGVISDTVLWTQKLFMKFSSPFDSVISQAQIDSLAQKYAPVLSLTKDEFFHPASVEYIYNNPDSTLASEDFHIRGPGENVELEFKYEDLAHVLSNYGRSDSVLKINNKRNYKRLANGAGATSLRKLYGTDASDRRVYYSSTFLTLKSISNNKVTALKGQFLVINYHFLYPFDYKSSVSPERPVWAAHAFDRESMSVIFRVNDKKTIFDSVVYGAHLPSQLMGLINPLNQKEQSSEVRLDVVDTQKTTPESVQMIAKLNTSYLNKDANTESYLQTWKSGRLMVGKKDMEESLSFGTHPLAMVAQGSHGMYPLPGKYAVILKDINLLVEEAGGPQLLVPENLKIQAGTQDKIFNYKLEKLETEYLTSCSKHSPLVYSGDIVDVQLTQNATFPPFTERESFAEKYLEVLVQTSEDDGAFKSKSLENPLVKQKIESIKLQLQKNIQQ